MKIIIVKIQKYNNKNYDLHNYDTNNISNGYSKYQHKYINYDLNKDLNDINLTSVEDNNRNNKASLYKIPKISLDNDSHIVNNNKNYSITLNNMKNNKKLNHKLNNYQ